MLRMRCHSIASVNIIKHWGSYCKIKRHVVIYHRFRITVNRYRISVGYDFGASNVHIIWRKVWVVAIKHSVLKYIFKVLIMNYPKHPQIIYIDWHCCYFVLKSAFIFSFGSSSIFTTAGDISLASASFGCSDKRAGK
jgi:hypothetical protein